MMYTRKQFRSAGRQPQGHSLRELGPTIEEMALEGHFVGRDGRVTRLAAYIALGSQLSPPTISHARATALAVRWLTCIDLVSPGRARPYRLYTAPCPFGCGRRAWMRAPVLGNDYRGEIYCRSPQCAYRTLEDVEQLAARGARHG